MYFADWVRVQLNRHRAHKIVIDLIRDIKIIEAFKGKIVIDAQIVIEL